MSKGYRFLNIVKFSIRGVLLIRGLIVIVIPRITFADGPDTMWTKIFVRGWGMMWGSLCSRPLMEDI